ncbi:MAG: hypothetical protein JWQ09_5050 [Segetibacter sp.]|nr:hypothetical protein [Segetibacter sp.]
MRKYILLACALALTCILTQQVNGQLVINGGSITIGDNAFITVQGDFTSNTDILGTGKIIMNGTSAQQMNMNGFTVPNLEINSTGGVTLAGNAKIGNTFNFVAGSFSTNPLTAFELIAPATATFSFAPSTEMSGKIRRTGWINETPITFNQGNVILTTHGGTPPTEIQVNMVPGGDPTGPEREVKRSFSFIPTGGAGYTVDMTLHYNSSTELNNNIENNLVPWVYTSNEWNAKFTGNTLNAASDFITTTGIDVANFANKEWKLADPRYTFNVATFLRGPWNSATTAMKTDLYNAGLIPLSQPYNVAPFNYAGTESVATIPNANIVDWVLLELRKPVTGVASDATSATIIGRKAAFLTNTGSIVDLDGVTSAAFDISKQGTSFVVVRHRNHLAVMSNAIPSNAAGTFANDFGQLANVYKNPSASSNPEIALASSSLFGLWAGDANKNNAVNSIDISSVKTAISNLLSGYQTQDVNLNGAINSLDVNLTKSTISTLGSSSAASRSSNTAPGGTMSTHVPE